MYTRIHCKVCMVNFETRAIEKSFKKTCKCAHAYGRAGSWSRCAARVSYSFWFLDRVLVPRSLKTAEVGLKMAARWPQDDPKMGHKAVLEVAFDR